MSPPSMARIPVRRIENARESAAETATGPGAEYFPDSRGLRLSLTLVQGKENCCTISGHDMGQASWHRRLHRVRWTFGTAPGVYQPGDGVAHCSIGISMLWGTRLRGTGY